MAGLPGAVQYRLSHTARRAPSVARQAAVLVSRQAAARVPRQGAVRVPRQAAVRASVLASGCLLLPLPGLLRCRLARAAPAPCVHAAARRPYYM